MKIKRFNNLWTIGLISVIAIQVLILALKFIVPEFVVGVAQIESVVKFGEYIDTHEWANLLFTFVIGFASTYFYLCACLRKRKVGIKEIIGICVYIILSIIASKFAIDYYTLIDMMLLIILPCVFIFWNKSEDKDHLMSLSITYVVHNVAQVFSLLIRDIIFLVQYPNTATFTILAIDGIIWLVILYFYFNNIKEV